VSKFSYVSRFVFINILPHNYFNQLSVLSEHLGGHISTMQYSHLLSDYDKFEKGNGNVKFLRFSRYFTINLVIIIIMNRDIFDHHLLLCVG
jgi:hypothetical protein